MLSVAISVQRSQASSNQAAMNELPSHLCAALLPFQKEGVAFAIDHGGRVLIGDEMGLGKTLQAIATCCAFQKDWPVLIVVPKSVCLVWAEEISKWIPALGSVNIIRSGKDLSSRFKLWFR